MYDLYNVIQTVFIFILDMLLKTIVCINEQHIIHKVVKS
jgi:hypothetical protein